MAFVVQDRRSIHHAQVGLRGAAADLRGSEWGTVGRTMFAQCALPLCALLCTSCLSPGSDMGVHASVSSLACFIFGTIAGLAPYVV